MKHINAHGVPCSTQGQASLNQTGGDGKRGSPGTQRPSSTPRPDRAPQASAPTSFGTASPGRQAKGGSQPPFPAPSRQKGKRDAAFTRVPPEAAAGRREQPIRFGRLLVLARALHGHAASAQRRTSGASAAAGRLGKAEFERRSPAALCFPRPLSALESWAVVFFWT